MNFCSLQMPVRHASKYLLAGLALALLPGLAPGQVAGTGAYAAAQQPPPLPATSGLGQVQQALQGLAMPFEANSGQFDKRVAFAGRTFAGPVFVTRQGQIVYSLSGAKAEAQHVGKAEQQPGWRLTETLVDARALKPYGGEQASTKVSRFAGAASYQAATYRNVYLGQAWPGIEVELAASGKGGSNVEKIFHVKPHADAERIQVRLDGAQSLRLGEKGELIARTGHGDVAYTAPIAFQQVGGKRFAVPVKYVLNKAGDGYGFALSMYDRTRPLVIDPLLQSTYLGGSKTDYIQAMGIDPQTGDILVSGCAESPDFPGTAGGAQPSYGGSQDGFVARLTGDLKAVSPQAITFPAQASHEFVSGGTVSIDPPATASSGLPVSYASTTPDVCTVSGITVTTVSAGTCMVVASQGGNAQWEPAADVAMSIVLVPDSGGEGGNGGGNGGGTGPAQATPVPVLGPMPAQRCY